MNYYNNYFRLSNNALDMFKHINPVLTNNAFKAMKQFQHDRIIGVPNAVLNWTNRTGFNTVLGINWKLFKRSENIEKRIYKDYPIYFNYLSRIAKSGWTFMNFEHPSKSTMIKRTNMNETDLNKSFETTLQANSSYVMIKTFSDLMHNLDSGHRKQVKLLDQVIYENKDGYILAPDILFPILEYFRGYAIQQKGGSFKNKSSINKEHENNKRKIIITNLKKKRGIPLKASSCILSLFKINEIDVLISLYRGIKFSKYSYQQMPYGRNSIEHGLHDPNNLTYDDFLKLLLICDNVSEDTIMNVKS